MSSASSPGRPLVLGIDGGGTHSRGRLATLSGDVLQEAAAGPLNHHTTSADTFRQSLRDLLATLLDSPAAEAHLQAVVIGSAAFFDAATPEDHRRLLHGLLPLDRTLLVGDAVTALHGATRGQPGVLLIAGTGSIAAALDAQGTFRCHGGLGPLLESDPGSALWMAARAVRSAQRHGVEHDHLDALGVEICRVLGFPQLTDAVLHLYTVPDAARQLARLAGHLALLPSRPAAWETIEAEAGRELAHLALPLLVRVLPDLPGDLPLPVHTSGSVLDRNPRVHASLERTLASLAGRPVSLRRPAEDAVAGALHLALRRAGAHGPGSVGTGASTEARS